MRRIGVLAILAIIATASDAAAEEQAALRRETELRPQLQLDLGLTVIAAGFELPLATRIALQIEAGIFGTYFLPWFDRGDDVAGAVGGLRATWFARDHGRGLYITPYVRAGYGEGEHDGVAGKATFVAAGAFVGLAFRLTSRLDLRVGGGAQYIHLDGDNGISASTPFVALDLAIGFRL